MRYEAPAREAVDRRVFVRQPLRAWNAYADLLHGADWPSIDELNARLPAGATTRFAAQTRELLSDGLHYEQRIAECGLIATRERNWHDLFNALIWLRHPEVKHVLNARQVVEIASMGTKRRSRAQCALTHFDEAGVIVTARNPALLTLWDAHDWYGLFWRCREAWLDGSMRVAVIGHALLEHALTPGQLLVGKALVQSMSDDSGLACAEAIGDGRLLCDPQELRPLPLSGIPGWHAGNDDEAFHRAAPCYQPLRKGRTYPSPWTWGHPVGESG